jgi:hypothetical protein
MVSCQRAAVSFQLLFGGEALIFNPTVLKRTSLPIADS